MLQQDHAGGGARDYTSHRRLRNFWSGRACELQRRGIARPARGGVAAGAPARSVWLLIEPRSSKTTRARAPAATRATDDYGIFEVEELAGELQRQGIARPARGCVAAGAPARSVL